MPTRVITEGVGVLPGDTMLERKLRFERERDGIRRLLMREPRGHRAMSGAILQPPCRPEADWGVVFIEVSGCLPMCGHGTIGVATVLVETGMVTVTEPVTEIRLDTPAGLVVASVQVRDGHAESVTLRNVASFAYALGAQLKVPGLGAVEADVAFGGNFYAIVALEALGIPFTPGDLAGRQRMLDAGLAIMDAVTEQVAPEHPEQPEIAGLERRPLPACNGHSPGLVRPLAVRHRHVRPDGAAACPRRAGAARRFCQRVHHRQHLHGTAHRYAHRRGPAGRHPHGDRAGLDHRHGPVPARPRRPVPGRLPAVSHPGVRAYQAAEIESALDWPAAVAALREALVGGIDPETEVPRAAFPFGTGQLLAMPSTAGGRAGGKLATVAPGHPARGLA